MADRIRPLTVDELEIARIQAEVKRLEARLYASEDPDVSGAIEIELAVMRAKLPRTDDQDGVPSPEPLPPPPDPAAVTESENLIRQSRVELMRGNKRVASELLDRAAEIAPGSATVMEALGDDLVNRRQYERAQEAYAKAIRIDPTNVGLERKHAEAALRHIPGLTIEDQLRAGIDGPLLTPGETYARGGIATVLSVILPGSGQLVMGRNAAGIFILVGWIAMIVWIVALRDQFSALVTAFTRPGSRAGASNYTVMFPIFLAGMLHLTSITMSASAAKAAPKRRVEHPAPPVDKPF